MPHTDFKYSAIVDDGTTLRITVRFYAGDVTTEDEQDPEVKGAKKAVTRYRRIGVLEEKTYVFPVGTDLRAAMRSELTKPRKGKNDTVAKARTPIPEQL